MEHTKGPWKAAGQGNGNGELSIFGPDGEIACIRNKAHLGDARLIAAAPDLLEALKKYGDHLGTCYANLQMGECNCGFEQAIAKAQS